MKNRILALALMMTGMSVSASGQLFKKLKEEVQNAAEDAIVQTTADKVAEKTAKSLDKLFEVEFGENGPTPVKDHEESLENIPEEYTFEWVYKLVLESGQFKKQEGEMLMTYHFKEGAEYWGSEYSIADARDMFMVYDGPTDQMIMFMNQEGQKMAMVMKFPDISTEEEAQEEYTITEIEGKEILGYSSKGYRIENSDFKFISYVTYEAPVSFTAIYGKSQYMPEGFEEEWLTEDGRSGMVMEMHMTDKKKKKNNLTMRCVELTESPRTLNTGEYQTLGAMNQE